MQGIDPRITVAIIGFAGGIIGTLVGGFFGVKWGMKQFAHEQQYEEIRKQRDYLREWLIHNYHRMRIPIIGLRDMEQMTIRVYTRRYFSLEKILKKISWNWQRSW